MPSTIIFTGNPGAGVSIAAAAAAIGMASHGKRTLLLSLGSAAGLSALLGKIELGPQPTRVINGLDVFAPDPATELANLWEQVRGQLPPTAARMAADELPMFPGAPAIFALLRLPTLQREYERVVVDAGPHETLLLALSLPDSARWLLRLLLGLDRGPGQNRTSVANALLPSSFLPTGFMDGAQDVRIRLERSRTDLTNPLVTCACYVLRPDSAALAEARLALPAIQLHGLAVVSVAVGPLDADGDFPAEAAACWPTKPWIPFTKPGIDGLAGLAGLTPALADTLPDEPPPASIQERSLNGPALAIELPGLPKGALGLTLSGDELIVRIGPYRRHMLLPDSLRGAAGIRATREGDMIVIRRRE